MDESQHTQTHGTSDEPNAHNQTLSQQCSTRQTYCTDCFRCCGKVFGDGAMERNCNSVKNTPDSFSVKHLDTTTTTVAICSIISSCCASFFGGSGCVTGATTITTASSASLAFLFGTASVNRQFETVNHQFKMASLERQWLAHLASKESELALKERELEKEERELEKEKSDMRFDAIMRELRGLRGTTSQDLQGQSSRRVLPNQEDKKSEGIETKTEETKEDPVAKIAGLKEMISKIEKKSRECGLSENSKS